MTADTNELADRINTAFQEVLSAKGNKLFCAIGLGEALKEAKEKIRQARKEAPAHLKPHVAKWPEWLTKDLLPGHQRANCQGLYAVSGE